MRSLALVLGAFVLAACGGGSGRLSRAELTSRATKICTKQAETVAQIPRGPANATNAAGYLGAVLSVVESGVKQFHKLKPPRDEEATRITAHVMRRLWRPAPADADLPSVADWARGTERMRDHFNGGTGPFPAALVEEAEALFADLLASSAFEQSTVFRATTETTSRNARKDGLRVPFL